MLKHEDDLFTISWSLIDCHEPLQVSASQHKPTKRSIMFSDVFISSAFEFDWSEQISKKSQQSYNRCLISTIDRLSPYSRLPSWFNHSSVNELMENWQLGWNSIARLERRQSNQKLDVLFNYFPLVFSLTWLFLIIE